MKELNYRLIIMKTLTTFLLLLIFFSPPLSAQNESPLLAKVSEAITEKQWDKADKLFHQAIREDAEKASNFYWVRVSSDCSLRKTLALDLGNYFRERRNYDKASPFFRELVQLSPKDIYCLSQCAAIETQMGEAEKALELYLKVLSMDADNLDANIFVGNYYFFYAEKKRRQLEADYAKLVSPTRMQSARYRNELSGIIITEYGRVKEYLSRVIKQFPSMEVNKTLDKIQRIEKEVNR